MTNFTTALQSLLTSYKLIYLFKMGWIILLRSRKIQNGKFLLVGFIHFVLLKLSNSIFQKKTIFVSGKLANGEQSINSIDITTAIDFTKRVQVKCKNKCCTHIKKCKTLTCSKRIAKLFFCDDLWQLAGRMYQNVAIYRT